MAVGDALVVPKLDRLARSVPDAHDIGDSLVARGVRLSLGGTLYDPAGPMGKMFLNILATFAEFEVDLLRMRTREGMAVARAKGKLRGKQPNQPGWLANLAASISSVVVAELTAATAAALAPARTVLTVQARNRSSADWSTPKSLTAASASWRGWWGLSRRGRKPRDPAYRRCRLGRSSGR